MQYAVTAHYQYSAYEQGEIISLHKSYDLAQKAAGSSFQGIAEVPDTAKRGENIRKYQ